MADDTNKKDARDHDQVAAGEEYEIDNLIREQDVSFTSMKW